MSIFLFSNQFWKQDSENGTSFPVFIVFSMEKVKRKKNVLAISITKYKIKIKVKTNQWTDTIVIKTN
jgi:hypothetical protein